MIKGMYELAMKEMRNEFRKDLVCSINSLSLYYKSLQKQKKYVNIYNKSKI